MVLMLITLGVVSLFELVLFYTVVWKWRQVIACVLIIVISINSGLIFGNDLTIWTALILLFSLYRLINLLRTVKDRISSNHLRSVCQRASVILIGCQLSVVLFVFINLHVQSFPSIAWYAFYIIQLLTSAVILISVNRQMRTTNPPQHIHAIADSGLPTLTVAIPARNETDDLNECLQSLTNSTYPKLEILVLDDCSQEKRTPEIIRKFAHDGVRFIAGEVPPERWLAKNFAYDQLVKESNGELILFCGVDVRFSANSLKLIAETILMKQKVMMSIMPKNEIPKLLPIIGKLIQPSRYSWELALPRRQFQRPPVLSTCWIIQRKTLKTFGGFEAISHSISPESYFARKCIVEDGYSFLKNNDVFGITCEKSVFEQLMTAIRTRYPQLHKRIELVCLTSMLEMSFMVMPYVLLLVGLFVQDPTMIMVSVFNCVLLGIFYTRMVDATYQLRVWYGFALLPFAVILDIGLLNYSMWKYEFDEVIWKDRNVCIPVMQTFESLPKLR
jgi:glycosyltransferase involved in cell wall biosynthesis